MFLDIDGHRVFTLSFGAGPRIFLAHSGWIGNVEDWLATLAIMSQEWRTVVYDHRGAGETRVPVEAISAEALRDDIFRGHGGPRHRTMCYRWIFRRDCQRAACSAKAPGAV